MTVLLRDNSTRFKLYIYKDSRKTPKNAHRFLSFFLFFFAPFASLR